MLEIFVYFYSPQPKLNHNCLTTQPNHVEIFACVENLVSHCFQEHRNPLPTDGVMMLPVTIHSQGTCTQLVAMHENMRGKYQLYLCTQFYVIVRVHLSVSSRL